jgi:23S rRNA pseudouridine955/2504/2580 synthase
MEYRQRLACVEKLLHPRVAIVAHDANGLIAICKGHGVLSHPNGIGVDRSAIFPFPYNSGKRCYQSPEGPIFLLNRLDSCTSGLMLITENGTLAAAIRDCFLHRQVKKIYHAFSFGHGSFHRQHWSDRLARRRENDMLRIGIGRQLAAETDAVLLKAFPSAMGQISLLQLLPITGRTHQLRFQCAGRRLPIIGDRIYGDFKKNRAASQLGLKNMQLHASHIQLEYIFNGRPQKFSANAPDLEKFLANGFSLKDKAAEKMCI